MKRRRKYQTLQWIRPNDETIKMRVPCAVAWTCARAIAQQVDGCVLFGEFGLAAFALDGSGKVFWNDKSNEPGTVSTYDSNTTVCI